MIVCAEVSVFPEYALMHQELKSASLHCDYELSFEQGEARLHISA